MRILPIEVTTGAVAANSVPDWMVVVMGLATVFGALMGFCFKNITHKFSDIALSFAAGVMLAAAVVGLIMPSIEYGTPYMGHYGVIITVAGIFAGAVCLYFIDNAVLLIESFKKGTYVIEENISAFEESKNI